jgi:rhomboid family GlyGly-CTERM serine protease
MPLKDGNHSRHGSFALPWRTLLLTLLATMAYFLLGPAPDAWVVSRQAVGQGEWWTLISGHWIHSDHQHALWNISALFILGSLFEQPLKHRIFTELILASLLLSLWMGVYLPELQAYCGLSGILNTLLVTGTITLWKQYHSPALLIILVLALLKNLVELFSHQAIFTHTLWPSVPEAHLVGMGIGIVFVLARTNTTRKAGIIPSAEGC